MSINKIFTGKMRGAARARLWAALAAVVVLGVAAVSTQAWLAPARATRPGAHPQGVEEVRTTVRRDGFQPTQATRAAGQVRVTVANESGAADLTFRLMRLGSGEVSRSRMEHGAARWSAEYELAGGRYVLTTVENPTWLFYITVE